MNSSIHVNPRGLVPFTYGYNYRTRRVVRDETGAGGVLTKDIFSGGLGVQEYDGGSTTATVEFLRGSDYGGGVGGILYSIRGGTPSYTHENRRGDVVAKTNDSGVLNYQAAYEAYGTRTQEQGTLPLDRQRANTKDEDPTGLLNEGFRYRDLETGSFITKDPLGFVDGPNVYTYVKQNPWTFFDPLGLKIDDEKHRVKEREVVDPGARPKRKDKEAFKKWETARDTAKENEKFNEDNRRVIQAWKNYDQAIEMLGATDEGKALLAELRSDRYNIVVNIADVIDLPYGGKKAVPVHGGVNKTYKDENGVTVGPVGLSPVVMGDKNNPTEAHRTVFHELYHSDDGVERAKTVYGTFDKNDLAPEVKYRQREARATRFENIISFGNGMPRNEAKSVYGSGTRMEFKVTNPLGSK